MQDKIVLVTGAASVAFLASDDAGFVTGVPLPADGGTGRRLI